MPRELQKPLKEASQLTKGVRGSGAEENLPPLSDFAVKSKAELLPKFGSEEADKAGLKTEEDYANRFLDEFDAKAGEVKYFRDNANQVVKISDELFKDVKGKWKVAKRGREQYLLKLAEAIKNPDEIWVDIEAIGALAGKVEFRRRYLKYDTPDMGGLQCLPMAIQVGMAQRHIKQNKMMLN